MTSALFGASGFVGGNLRAATAFDRAFTSADSASAVGEAFDLVVFAAARAEKWRINQDPESDLVHIAELERLIRGVRAERFVLISTVDVYADPRGVDEETPIDTRDLHPYGAHRYRLEQTVRETHADALIVRLPGLYGPGLKKNVIYDFLHDNNVDRIHRSGSFQYYGLPGLWVDITTALGAGLPLVNLASEPIRTDALAREVFGLDFDNEPEGVTPGSYDMRSVHAGVFGATGGYRTTAAETLAGIRRFVDAERRLP